MPHLSKDYTSGQHVLGPLPALTPPHVRDLWTTPRGPCFKFITTERQYENPLYRIHLTAHYDAVSTATSIFSAPKGRS